MSPNFTQVEQKANPLSRPTVIAMAAACAFAVATLYYNQPLLPEMAATFGRSSTDASILATLTQLGYASGLLLFVPLGDRMARKKLILTLLALNMASLIGVAKASSFLFLEMTSYSVGLTAVTAQIIIPALSGLAPSEHRGKIVGTLLSGLSAGLLLARTLSGVVGVRFGWRTMFLAAVAIDFLLMAMIFFRLPKTNPNTTLSYGALLASLWALFCTQPVLRTASLIGLLMFAAFSALWGSLAALLAQQPFHYGSDLVGAFGVIGIAGLLASPWIGFMVDRFGCHRLRLAGCSIMLLAFVLIAKTESHIAFLILGMILLDFGSRAGLVSNQTEIYALSPSARSRLNTIFMTSYFLGGAIGSSIATRFTERFGWHGLAVCGMTFAALALATSAKAAVKAAVLR